MLLLNLLAWMNYPIFGQIELYKPCYQVSPCHVEGPEEFYVQLLDSQQPIEDLCEKIQDYYSSNNADKYAS